MQSLTYRRENSNISLGERREKSDLARFSLDPSWARAVSDGARSRAYPSPPMSESPPLPPRRNPDSCDRDHGSYRATGQDVFRGVQISQAELAEQGRGQPSREFQQPFPPTPYSSYRMEENPPQLQYQQHRPQILHQQLPPYPQQPPPLFSAPHRSSVGERPNYSPKAQRKTKGHVASACVPCKRAHLRCDAQRPCSRCLSNGKEDTCVDVQHKKRGRPRLRDEREPRYEAVGPNYPPPEPAIRRPLSLYTPSDAPPSAPFGDPIHRSNSYRVLKSQAGPPMGSGMSARYLEHASIADANLYVASMPPMPRRMGQQEPICAYLTMEMQIAKATQGFGEAIGMQSVVARRFQDLVSADEREKVSRLQSLFEDERREREPNYLPPIYPKFEEDRAIQSIGFASEELDQFRPDHQERFTFQGLDGQQRTFEVRLGLAKKESTYFIVILLNPSNRPQIFNQPPSSPFSRESYSRDSQYGYQTQQVFAQPSASPFLSNPPFGDPRAELYRAPGPIGHNIPPSTTMPPFSQPQARPEYSQIQNPYQTPRSELLLAQTQPQRQHDLQLPPIRDQRAEASASHTRQIDQNSRLDIEGLLDRPGMGRGGN